MTTRSSIRTDWPGPPRHRHRKASTRRRWALPGRWGIPGRIGLGVVALLAGVLALNGIIQASGAPARTAGSSPGVDIASLLPPPAATPTTAPAPTAQVANVDAQTQVARSSESHPPVAPRRTGVATRVPTRAATQAGGQAPGRQTEAAAGQNRTTPDDKRPGDERSSAGQPASGGSAAIAPGGEAPSDVDNTPEPARNDATRPGHSGGLLDTVRCAVKVSDKPLLGGCP
jgi:hypothetical protein